MNKRKTIFAIFFIILVSIILWRFAKNFKKYSTVALVSVITYQNEYLNGDNLKVKITNNLGKKICFSTCYPYRLEKKEENWQPYSYVECGRDDIHNGCVENGKAKTFELTLPENISGIHRIAVPFCIECKEGEIFRENSIQYSNNFTIK